MPESSKINSDIVVISWWSNCLGLACLHNLVQYTTNRTIYLLQAGKREKYKNLFRYYMPQQVIELPYGSHLPAEDWIVRERVVRDLLKTHSGVWFVDHDCFFKENIDFWLQQMDQRFSISNICLSHRNFYAKHSLTNPAFWISPTRLPEETPSFAPESVPDDTVQQDTYASNASADFVIPLKDTLVSSSIYLHQHDLVYEFAHTDSESMNGEEVFPAHEHLGGLSILTWPVLPEHLHEWAKSCIDNFRRFFQACPPQWRSIEDPLILKKIFENSDESVA